MLKFARVLTAELNILIRSETGDYDRRLLNLSESLAIYNNEPSFY